MAVGFRGAGGASGGVGALTATWPGSQQEDDFALLLHEVQSSQSPTAPSGWTEVSGSPLTNASYNHKFYLYGKLVAASESSVTVADSGDHQVAQILVFSGVDTATPIEVTATSNPGPATALVGPGVTTTSDGAGVVFIFGLGRDADSTASVTDWTNSNLASITEITDFLSSAGGGGGFAAAWGIKTTAGATGDTTATQAASAVYTAITVALKPDAGGASAVYSELADAYSIRASASTDLADSYAIRAAIAADLADSYSVRAAVLADLSDSFGISAAVATDLLDAYLIRATATTDLADSYSIAAAIAADLADSYEILSAGVVTSDLEDSYTIRSAVSSDVADSYSIRAAIVSDLADSYAVRTAAASDLSDTYAIIVSASADIADSYVIRAAVSADLADGYSIGDAVVLPCPSAAEIAEAVWSHASGSDIAVKLAEAWGRLGLDPTNPLISGQTEISFGAIVMALTGNETASTLTRQ